MTAGNSIWVVDDDRSIRWVVERALTQAGLDCRSFSDADRLLSAMATERPDVVISDIRMPGTDGFELLAVLKQQHPNLPVIITTAHSDLDSTVTSYEGGAFEYLPKPFDVDEMVATVERARVHSLERKRPVEEPRAEDDDTGIIGSAPKMQEVFRAIGRLAQSHITVLINGESGTGKELVARALHDHSPRRRSPFIALNMAAIPKELMESELFGHEKGAFTGATSRREGRFEQADGGTLFLDEIGDMPADTQTRLLRVLADGEFYRVGGMTSVRADVRIIAATHQNLESLVARGDFREDLYHRLNVIRIHLPTLAERREDIPQLAKYFLGRAAAELDVESKILSRDAEQFLAALPWPGNVRQLENTCRWLTVMAAGSEILLSDLPPELLSPSEEKPTLQGDDWRQALTAWVTGRLSAGESKVLRTALPAFEQIMIECALQYTGGRRAEAAELLGWGRNTLTRKLKELEAGDGLDNSSG
ncbi:nitrogen regulation protein [Luminiphilus syltensis NOR5-1B]|uniref:DNA-binding transcriptional regulator NtrC n=1 Tax=Luminiphilus syltensis NOR5-1B TaxID=565045 RepID=B8KUP4_9GAMM|nr:nitrogen regulation protein NR(I) [Luminiphilus syltensis]EED34076.1 nitrogen regulation protein [Luminiphilus syltensis NOR5-1B]